MGEFRDRMERDLQIRGFSRSTQQCYLARMKAMVRFFMRPPDELTLEDVHAYQLHLTRDRKIGWATFNQSVGAIRFFAIRRQNGVEGAQGGSWGPGSGLQKDSLSDVDPSSVA